MTNIHSLYGQATVHPPIKPDNEYTGAPSDHQVVVAAAPVDLAAKLPVTKTVIRTRRNLCSQNLAKISNDLTYGPWDLMESIADVNIMRKFFITEVINIIDKNCPEQKVKIRINPNINPLSKLAMLSKKKSDIFKRKGNTPEYREVKKRVEFEKKEAGRRAIEKVLRVPEK